MCPSPLSSWPPSRGSLVRPRRPRRLRGHDARVRRCRIGRARARARGPARPRKRGARVRGRPRLRPLAVLLAFPVAMALATGVEAPSSAVAQLGQLDPRGRVRFGRVTLWLTLGIVAWLTIGMTAVAVRLRVGLPPSDSTQIAEVARAAVGEGTGLRAFQADERSAAAGGGKLVVPGRTRAAEGARRGADRGRGRRPPGAARARKPPPHAVLGRSSSTSAVAAVVVAAAGGREQELVLFYAVAVFMSLPRRPRSRWRVLRREGARLLPRRERRRRSPPWRSRWR